MPIKYPAGSGSASASSGGLPLSWVMPFDPRLFNVAPATISQFGFRACRVTLPKAGTLMDLHVYVGTSSGNLRGSVYDTSEPRNRLWDGSSTASAADWVKLGDPTLAVSAGQQLDLAVMADNGTVALGGVKAPTTANTAALKLPTGFDNVGLGGRSFLMWAATQGSFVTPTQLAEASMAFATTVICLIARVA